MSTENSVKEKMRHQLLDLQESNSIEKTNFQKKYSIDFDFVNVLVVVNLSLEHSDPQHIEYVVYLHGIVDIEEGNALLIEYTNGTYHQGDLEENGGIALFTNIDQFVEFIFDYFYDSYQVLFGDDY